MSRKRRTAPPYSPRRVYLLPDESLYDGCAVNPRTDCDTPRGLKTSGF